MATRPALEFSQLLASKVQSASQGLDSTSHDLSSYSAIQSHPDILSDSLLSLYSTLSQSPQAIISTESYSQYSHAKSQKNQPDDSSFFKSLSSYSSSHQFPSLDSIKTSLEKYILLIYNDAESQSVSALASNPSTDHEASFHTQTQALDDIQWAIVGYSAISVYSHLVSSLCSETLPLSHDIFYWDSILNSSHNTLSTLLYLAQTTPKKIWDSIIPTYPNSFGANKFGLKASSNANLNPLAWFKSNTDSPSNTHPDTPHRDLTTIAFDLINSIVDSLFSWYSALDASFTRAQSVARQLFASSSDTSSSFSSTSADASDTSSQKPSIWSSLSVFFLLYSPLNNVRREISDHKSELAHLRKSTATSLGYLVGESFRILQTQHSRSSSQLQSSNADTWKTEIQNSVNTLAKVLQIDSAHDHSSSSSSSSSSSLRSPSGSTHGSSKISITDESTSSLYSSTKSSDSSDDFDSDETNSSVSKSTSGKSKLGKIPTSTFNSFRHTDHLSELSHMLDSPVVVAGKLLNIIESDLELHASQYSLVTASHRKPAWILRNWIAVTISAFVGVSAARSIIGNWENIVEWFKTDIIGTLVDFYNNWIVGPLTQIYNTVRHDDTGSASLITKQSLQADIDSLERMVIQFAIDHGEIAPTAVSNSSEIVLDDNVKAMIAEKVRQGDISSVLRPYESQITTPIKSLITGDLVRSLLIQIQKTKVDVETAVSGIDKLLQSQQLVFGFVAAMPSFAVTYWGLVSPVSKWINGQNRRSRADYQKRESLSVVLGHIDRILGALRNEEIGFEKNGSGSVLSSCPVDSDSPKFNDSSTNTPTNATDVQARDTVAVVPAASHQSQNSERGQRFYTLLGLLLCETFLLRDQGKNVLPKSRLADWDQDISDLEDVTHGVETQQRAVIRIWNVYQRYLN